jgi:putative transcriptional regulator
MTIHHPDGDILLSYAAGALGESWSIGVASHLAFCEECRRSVDLLEELGGHVLDRSPINPVPEFYGDLSLDVVDGGNQSNGVKVSNTDLPSPLNQYVAAENINSIDWRHIGGGVHEHAIETADDGNARLLKIPGGRVVPEHGHHGRELTLVLRGSFGDHNGEFFAGDVADVSDGVVHKPVAHAGADCICLVITDAPLKFSGIIPNLVQRLF